jgi:hypothetical protein
VKKTAVVIGTLIFLISVIQFFSQETERYELAESRIQKIDNDSEISTFQQLYGIIDAAEKTLINVDSFANNLIKRKAQKEVGWLLKDGTVITYVDNWMLGTLKEKAEPHEIEKMYAGCFEAMKSGFFFSSIIFYLLHLTMFVLMSIIPLLLSLLAPAMPALSLEYAAALILIIFIMTSKQAKAEETAETDQTFFEVDLFNQGEENKYEFFLMNFKKRLTSVLYLPSNGVIVATGPSMTLGNGSLSFLGGIQAGPKITDFSLWYVYFTSLFKGKADYVTFGLYDRPVHSNNWWIWFKHELNFRVAKKWGIGLREDTLIDPSGCRATYGPVLKLKWNSLTIWNQYRMGGEKPVLFLRAEVPIH